MKKLGIFLILCLVVLVVMPITAHGQSSKPECKGDAYNGKYLKVFRIDPTKNQLNLSNVEVCIQQGWELKPFSIGFFVLTKK